MLPHSLEEMAAGTPVIAWALDPAGRVIRVGGGGLELLGMQPDDLIGRHLSDIVPTSSEALDDAARALAGEVVNRIGEFGGRIWRSVIAPMVDATGDVVQITALAVEVTDMARAWDERDAALEDTRQARSELAYRLGLLAEYHDPATGEHLQRVAKLTQSLAEAIGLEDPETIGLAAVLHDVGKVGLPRELILVPGPLRPMQRSLVETHSELGYQLLNDSPVSALMGIAAEVARSHHERWDGTGYPRGLAGEAIPLPARVCSIADVWDALISDRPYRAALPREVAAETIRRGAGTQFDPALVGPFLELVDA